MRLSIVAVIAAIATCLAGTAPCQTNSFASPIEVAAGFYSSPDFNVMSLRMGAESPDNDSTSSNADSSQRHGLMKRVVRRVLEDQKGIYAAPFRPSNLKWDVLFLAGTGGLLATDRRIETHVPHSDFKLYQDISNATLGSMSGVSSWRLDLWHQDGSSACERGWGIGIRNPDEYFPAVRSHATDRRQATPRGRYRKIDCNLETTSVGEERNRVSQKALAQGVFEVQKLDLQNFLITRCSKIAPSGYLIAQPISIG